MDIDTIREVVTVVCFLAFVGVVVFAAHPKNKQRFEEAAQLPFEPGEAPTADGMQRSNHE